jgi:hypothetical protein
MEELKIFEIRDSGTFVPTIAIGIKVTGNDISNYLLGRAGYGKNRRLVLLHPTTTNKANYDSFAWDDRTFSTAHEFIESHWDELKTGDVIDVEFILGETTKKKISEFYGELQLP